MTDDWNLTLTQDGDRWGFVLTLNGIWHSGGRNYRSKQAALNAAGWHKASIHLRVPSIQDQLAAMGL